MERPDYEIAYIKDYCPASGEVVEKHINSLEATLARKRESVNELGKTNIRLEAENKKAKDWCLYMLKLMMPEAEPFDDLPGLTTQVDHAFARVRDKLEAEVERLKQGIRYPHTDCFYSGGCGCNNLRLNVEPKEAAKKTLGYKIDSIGVLDLKLGGGYVNTKALEE